MHRHIAVILIGDTISIRIFIECASVPSIYQVINQRANAIKTCRWQQYTPLTAFQLTDYDAAADDPENEETRITLLAYTADPNPSIRSTRRVARPYKQFRVIKRPTEVRAIMHASGVPMLDDDYEVIALQPVEQKRFCILCKCRHPVNQFVVHPEPDFSRQSASDFIRHKQYLHHVSYACETSLRHGWRGHRWRLSA